MKIKFKIQDGDTGKVHRLVTSGTSMKQCQKKMVGRLILMGVDNFDTEKIQIKIIKS